MLIIANHFLLFCCLGWTGETLGSTVTSQLLGLWFDPELKLPSMRYFACSLQVSVDLLPTLQFPPISKHMLGELGTLNCPGVWMSMYMMPGKGLMPKSGFPPCTQYSWDRLWIPQDPDQDKMLTKDELLNNHFVLGTRSIRLNRGTSYPLWVVGKYTLDRSPILGTNDTRIHTYGQFGESSWPKVFGLWEETGVPKQNTHRHGERHPWSTLG